MPRRPFRPRRLALAAVLGLVAASPLAARAAGDPATYVSERFRKVAVRVLQDVLAEEIARSCPPGRPMCAPLARRLTAAVGAAVEGDDQAVRAALGALFLEASVQGLVQATTGEAWSGPAPLLDPDGAAPLVSCLAAGLSGRPSREPCSLGAPAAAAVAALLAKLPCKGGDKPHCEALVSTLREGRAVPPPLALRALAGLAASDPVQRPDLALLFRELASLAERGVEGGLSPAVLRFLSGHLAAQTASDFAAAGLVDFRAGEPAGSALWDEGHLEAWAGAIARCGQPPGPLAAWRTRHVELLEGWRRQILLGQSLDTSALDALLAYRPECTDEADANRIAQLRRFVRYFTPPLRLHAALGRWGPGVLAAAAALDHVRTRDVARLERDLHRAFVYSVAVTGRQRLVARALLAEERPGAPPSARVVSAQLPWLGDALATCEVSALATALGVSMPPAERNPELRPEIPSGQCRSIVDGTPRPVPALPARPPGTTLTAWLATAGPALAGLVAPILEGAAADLLRSAGGRAGELGPSILSRCAAALAEADPAALRLVLLRAGADLLAEHLERVTAEMVGASAARCREDRRARTIFSGVGAGCAVHALVTGAYRPVVEYYWAGGTDAEGIATAGYRGLLADEALRYTPIILNVGLGATYVSGRSSQWGDGGYAALTVVDKIGLAFYKRLDERNPFEFGLFAGGFLDALVRTASDSGTARRYWLLGLTAGWPQLGGRGLGFEVHAGAAMPFELGRKEAYGFAAGAAIVVPFDTVLED